MFATNNSDESTTSSSSSSLVGHHHNNDNNETQQQQQQQSAVNPNNCNSSNNGRLEGTLLHTTSRSKYTTTAATTATTTDKSTSIKRGTVTIRMYTIFDMSGSAGANLEIGGLGSLKCYRFIVDDTDMVVGSNIGGGAVSSGKWKKKRKGIIDAAYASSTTRFTNTTTNTHDNSNYINDNQANIMTNKTTIINNHKAQLALNIPGYLPWIVIDVENDPTCFIVEISTVGYQPPPLLDENGGVEEEERGNSELNGEDRSNSYVEAVIKEEEEEEQDDDDDYEHDDGVFVFWGDDDENDIEEEEEMDNKRLHSFGLKKPTTKSKASPSRSPSFDQVQVDLARAISKNKPYIRYTFKCLSSRKNEKALWLAAFSKVGRLSDESRRKKTLFGTTSLSNTVTTSSSSYLVPKSVVSQSKKHSRIRKTSSQSKTAVDFDKLSSLGNGGGGGLNSNSGENDNEEELSSSVIDQKEYRVRPNYSYQHRWMTNSELKEEMMCPSSVMHDTRLSPTILATTDNRRELGLLRVEVLQCLGLPRVNKGKSNPNCVVYLVLGSYAFATDVIPQKKNPMWLRGMRRACALPVFHGYANLMIGVFHDDGSKGSSSKDTFFGRVEVPISRLRSNTTYDVTLPLRQSTSVYNREKLGAVRFRFSLEYYDDKQVVLSYAPNMRNMIGNRVGTTVACADPKSFRNVALTVHGTHLPDRFSTDMFKAAIRELTFVQAVALRYGKQYVRDLIYWKYPIFSAYCFGGWMHCVYSNSVIFVPVYLVGFLLLHLVSSYTSFIRNERTDIRPLSWNELFISLHKNASQPAKGGSRDGKGTAVLRTLTLGGSSNETSTLTEFPFSSFADYTKFSVDESLNTSRQNSGSEEKEDGMSVDGLDDVEDDLSDAGCEEMLLDGSEKQLPEQNVGAKKQKKKKDKSIKQELEEVEEKVQKATKYMFQYHTYYSIESDEPPFGKKVAGEKGNEVLDKLLGVGQFSQWNPIVSKVTSQFIPITRIFGVILSLYRSLYNIVTWRDPILSFWVSIAGMAFMAALLVFPWRLAFFVCGLVFLGPQNWIYRIFRERFLDTTKNKKPGRIVRAVREILKDNEGNTNLWSKSDRKKTKSSTSNVSQPLFRCHAPVSNPLIEQTSNVGAQHVVVPYSAVYFNRFYDWPPDPDHTRVFSGSLSFNASLCPSSANDVVSAPKLAQPRSAKKKLEAVSSTDLSKNTQQNREVISQSKSARVTMTTMRSQQSKKDSESSGEHRTQSVNVMKLSSAAKTMGNRVAARMTAKLQPTLSKYNKQVSSKLLSGLSETSASKHTDSVQSSEAKAADEDTVDDGIPSVIETVTTQNTGGKTDHDSQHNSEVESTLKDGNDDQLLNYRDQAVRVESKECIEDEEEKAEYLSKIDENQDVDMADAQILSRDGAVEEFGETTNVERSEDDASALLDASFAEDNNSDPDRDDDNMDVLRSSPSSDSTTLLHQLMAIKLELATARTENDNFRKKLQETEEERDMYKEKFEVIQSRVGFLANTPLLNTKAKTMSTPKKDAFNLFGKKKNPTEDEQT